MTGEEIEYVEAALSTTTYTVKDLVGFLILSRVSRAACEHTWYGPQAIAWDTEELTKEIEQIRKDSLT